MKTIAKWLCILCLALAASACQLVPGQGPITAEIVESAGHSAEELSLPSATVFDLVTVDAATARLISQYRVGTLAKRFGFGQGRNAALIGVGDALRVTIFEAGSDGLFSTVENKQTSFDLVVQPDGTAAIPYVGNVRFAGRTLAQARATIRSGLEGKAVQPDVIVTALSTASRSVTVSGAVRTGGRIPLDLNGNQLAEVIAKAGGNAAEPYETFVTVTRGDRIARVRLAEIIEDPRENIYVYPGDQVFLARDPQSFTVMGEAVTNRRVEFTSSQLNLIEAVALAGGGSDNRVDATGYFVFRFERPEIVEALLGRPRLEELRRKGMEADEFNRYPVAYRFDMSAADSLFVAQNFRVNSRDVIYLSRHPAVDFAKFIEILRGPVSLAASVRDTVMP